jgi:hypothetical protein
MTMPTDPVAVFDPSLATAAERALLMCIERIDELERRLQDAERRLQDAECNSLVNLMTAARYRIVVYIETMCFVLGASPIEHADRIGGSTSVFDSEYTAVFNWAAACDDPVALARASELHRACFPSMDGHPPSPPSITSPAFRFAMISGVYNVQTQANVVAMLRALSADEVERMREWRLIRTRWAAVAPHTT